MTRQSKLEIRVWEGSPIVGWTKKQIEDKFGILILKATRGNEARNPLDYLKLDAGDYIFIYGESQKCLDFIHFSKKNKSLIETS